MAADLPSWLDRMPPWLDRVLDLARVDFAPEHRQPGVAGLVGATIGAVVGSLLADKLLVMAGTKIFPKTAGYAHFVFSDYAKLTVIGVIIACVAWPIVTRISSEPRWLFFRQAIAVTLVLWLPDLYLLYKGQPGDAVAVLMVMHLAIAVVTYNALVHIARVRPAVASHRHAASADRGPRRRESADRHDDQDYYGQDYYGQDYHGEDSYREDYQREPVRPYPGQREPADPYQGYYRETTDPYEGRRR